MTLQEARDGTAADPEDRDLTQARIEFGRETLGPIIHRFLFQLHAYMLYDDGPQTVHLFCARAGVRIQELYRDYVRLANLKDVARAEMFWVSRMLVCKGVYNQTPDAILDYIVEEFRHRRQADIVRALLHHRPDLLQGIGQELPGLNGPAAKFKEALREKGAWQKVVNDYLQSVSREFNTYFRQRVGSARRVVLIDSGWQGSTQSLLAESFPELDFRGLYFGRILMGRQKAQHVPEIVGVVFENDAFKPDVPESAIVLHRHLIETLFEPNSPSIEEVAGHSAIGDALIEANLNEVVSEEADAHYIGVRNYLAENAATLSPDEILARHDTAMLRLAEMIATPTRADVRLLETKERSTDFGRTEKLPVLLDPAEHKALSTEDRIRKSLWTQGQIAIELDPAQAREAQLRSLKLTSSASFFHPSTMHRTGRERTPVGETALPPGEGGLVAIITRTKNRPLLLKRAEHSVARQTYSNYHWVVVNDGGSEEAVLEVIKASSIDPKRITLVSNETSCGMEAASNLGIRAVDSEYIVIHDDDDSWQPNFLEQTVSFLSGAEGRHYGGVITKSFYISEEIRGKEVIQHGKAPYQDWVRNVQLIEMAAGNFFPPIAFLFRRSVYDAVGGFDERLPVLGDWAFNLSFLLKADIAVLQEHLANYHHRDRGDTAGVYSNSVIGGRSKHEEFNAIVSNRFIRETMAGHPGGLSIAFGFLAREIRNQTANVAKRIAGEPVPTAAAGGTPRDDLSADETDRRWVALQIATAAANRRITRTLGDFLGQRPKIDAAMDWNAMKYFFGRFHLPPPPDFDEESYLIEYADVRMEVEKGRLSSGFEHFVRHGRFEGRNRHTRTA